jgi:hypothetical protein|tara:strand:+ start:2653 stop:3075 length:423 start_codon:yes stop_codon:yes gene_type:complete
MDKKEKIKSPAYFGKLAKDYKLYDIEMGVDNLEWCVVVKNNRYVWVRKTEDIELIKCELKNNNSFINESVDIKNEKKGKIKKKYTQYNEYLEKKMKELRESNIELTPKKLFSVAVTEWHNIKNNKEELNNYLYNNIKKND